MKLRRNTPLREERAEVPRTAYFRDDEEELEVLLQGYAALFDKVPLEMHDDSAAGEVEVADLREAGAEFLVEVEELAIAAGDDPLSGRHVFAGVAVDFDDVCRWLI